MTLLYCVNTSSESVQRLIISATRKAMEPWVCPPRSFDIRTASSDGPCYRRAEFSPSLLAEDDFGPRVRFRPLGADTSRRNEDGTINVVVESSCKLRDEEGFEFYVRDEEMPFDEDRYHEFKGPLFV